MLVKYGADVNATDKNGETPLDMLRLNIYYFFERIGNCHHIFTYGNRFTNYIVQTDIVVHF